MTIPINLWLDDHRPAPPGWSLAKSFDEAVELASHNPVAKMSLDHDLGACKECLRGMTDEEWLESHQYQSMPHCDHAKTGYDFVVWMETNNIWPAEKPTVHSANPAGAARMRAAIDHSWNPQHG